MQDPPPFCGPINSSWMCPTPLPETRLVIAHHDHRLMRGDDFVLCGIELPAQLENAVPKRRAEYLAGRLCARHALHQLTGLRAAPVVRDGSRAPQWPAGCVGSITHTDGWAAAIVGKQQDYLGLGIDIERLLDQDHGHRLAPDILTTGERLRLKQVAPESIGLAVTLTFSLKESLFKALQPLVGRNFYFEHAELMGWAPTGQARLRLLCDLDQAWRAGREVPGRFWVHGEHLMSLVAVTAEGTSGAHVTSSG